MHGPPSDRVGFRVQGSEMGVEDAEGLDKSRRALTTIARRRRQLAMDRTAPLAVAATGAAGDMLEKHGGEASKRRRDMVPH